MDKIKIATSFEYQDNSEIIKNLLPNERQEVIYEMERACKDYLF